MKTILLIMFVFVGMSSIIPQAWAQEPPHDPYADDERLRLAAEKKITAEETMGFGSGIGFFDESNFQLNTIIIAILIGTGSGIGLTLYWKKRK